MLLDFYFPFFDRDKKKWERCVVWMDVHPHDIISGKKGYSERGYIVPFWSMFCMIFGFTWRGERYHFSEEWKNWGWRDRECKQIYRHIMGMENMFLPFNIGGRMVNMVYRRIYHVLGRNCNLSAVWWGNKCFPERGEIIKVVKLHSPENIYKNTPPPRKPL